MKYFFKIVPLLFMVVYLSACKKDAADIEKVEKRMELKSSTTDISLDESHLDDDILNFEWTETRLHSSGKNVSYSTQVNVVGSDFGPSTAVLFYEDEGVFKKSFTSKQLQNWATEKWHLPANTSFMLEFRVIAELEGSTSDAPDVRTTVVNVKQIKTFDFDVDKMSVKGSALVGSSPVDMKQTLENENQYAQLLDLKAGELQFSIEFQSSINYLCPEDGQSNWADGMPKAVKVRSTPISWTIPKAGEYRVVADLEKKTVSVFSPDNKLEPLVVDWVREGLPFKTTVNELWLHGDINNWGTAVKGGFVPSLADPQILVRKGLAVSGNAKFVVDGAYPNNAYAFSCVLDVPGQKQTKILEKKVWMELGGGSDRGQRDSQLKLPSGTTLIILDLRKKMIFVN